MKDKKRIIIDEDDKDTINFSQINHYNDPIFAERDGKTCGMIVSEEEGWILRLGGRGGANGFHVTLRDCLISCRGLNFEFYI